MKIGVLALQGAFAEHLDMLRTLNVEGVEIRQPAHLTSDINGVILPGGESTVMRKLLHQVGLFHPLQEAINSGMPIFGTCAGMILLANKISNGDEPCFAALNACVERNAYGRQLGSFETIAEFAGIGPMPMVFIRAPYFVTLDAPAQALARVNGHIVAARQGNVLATAFHPELTDDSRIHQYFLTIVSENYQTVCQTGW